MTKKEKMFVKSQWGDAIFIIKVHYEKRARLFFIKKDATVFEVVGDTAQPSDMKPSKFFDYFQDEKDKVKAFEVETLDADDEDDDENEYF